MCDKSKIFEFNESAFDPIKKNTFIRVFRKIINKISESKEKLAVVISPEKNKIEILNYAGESRYQAIFLNHLPLNILALEKTTKNIRFFTNKGRDGLQKVESDISGIR